MAVSLPRICWLERWRQGAGVEPASLQHHLAFRPIRIIQPPRHLKGRFVLSLLDNTISFRTVCPLGIARSSRRARHSSCAVSAFETTTLRRSDCDRRRGFLVVGLPSRRRPRARWDRPAKRSSTTVAECTPRARIHAGLSIGIQWTARASRARRTVHGLAAASVSWNS